MLNIGWAEFLVLVVVGLFVFGPERLPGAAAWAGRAARQLREYASGARDYLRSELGPEYDEFQKPLEDLRSLRDFNPKRAATKYLFEDGEPAYNGHGGLNGYSASNGHAGPNGYPGPNVTRSSLADDPPLHPGEMPPFDSDAT